MTNKAVKVGLTVVVLGLALGGLLRATLKEGTEYYKHVGEVVTDQQAWEGKRLQLHGYVVRDSILRKRDSLDYRFKVTHKVGDGERIIAARYTGIVPDTFADDAEVVLKGTLEAGVFHVTPNGVMAKCPSKYEAKKGAASPGA